MARSDNIEAERLPTMFARIQLHTHSASLSLYNFFFATQFLPLQCCVRCLLLLFLSISILICIRSKLSKCLQLHFFFASLPL
jgi:hypothetical protein